MAIAAISSALNSSYLPQALAADGVASRVRQMSRDDSGGRQGSEANSTDNANAAAIGKAPYAAQDTQKGHASAEALGAQIQFKDSEGTQVMEVFDSKNILIYQVPPKGYLMLIHSQEKQHANLVETSA